MDDSDCVSSSLLLPTSGKLSKHTQTLGSHSAHWADPATHPLGCYARAPPSPQFKKIRSLICQSWGLTQRPQLARPGARLCDHKRDEVPRWSPAPLWRPAALTDGKPHAGRGLPKENRGRPPAGVPPPPPPAPPPWTGRAGRSRGGALRKEAETPPARPPRSRPRPRLTGPLPTRLFN